MSKVSAIKNSMKNHKIMVNKADMHYSDAVPTNTSFL